MKRLNLFYRAGGVERVHDDVRDERREQFFMMERWRDEEIKED